jgi:hypothetical protein
VRSGVEVGSTLGKLGQILVGKEKHLVAVAFVRGVVRLEVRDAHGVLARQAASNRHADMGGGLLLAHGARHRAGQRLDVVMRLHEA